MLFRTLGSWPGFKLPEVREINNKPVSLLIAMKQNPIFPTPNPISHYGSNKPESTQTE